jgi:hypothetical protein
MAKNNIVEEMDELANLASAALLTIATTTGRHPVNVALAMATVAIDVMKEMGRGDPRVPGLLAQMGHYALTDSADEKVTH